MPKITQSFQLYYNETLYGKSPSLEDLYNHIKRRTDVTQKTKDLAYKIFQDISGKSTIDWHYSCCKASSKIATKYAVVKDNKRSEVHTMRLEQIIQENVFNCTKGFFLKNDQRII